jgi:nicotinate (nicotinamide) nucleotide adenylyltransferase
VRLDRRVEGRPAALGILAGTFNPPTRAHVCLARAALGRVDEVLFVLPRAFPHKSYGEVGFAERLEMLAAALKDEPRFSIATSEGGLFIEMARECREVYPPETRLVFLCGRDAAERIVNWDYGEPWAFLKMLDEFELLVAPRGGPYLPPEAMRRKIHSLECDCGEISATEVRERIRHGEPWEALVPREIVEMVRERYGRRNP